MNKKRRKRRGEGEMTVGGLRNGKETSKVPPFTNALFLSQLYLRYHMFILQQKLLVLIFSPKTRHMLRHMATNRLKFLVFCIVELIVLY